jgi:hypothetical protein
VEEWFMEWMQVMTIIASVVGILAGLMLWLFTKLEKDIAGCKIGLDGWVMHLTAMQAEQTKRMDELHRHLSELVRSRKI